ncbi:MAG: hypothetical protein C0410_00715 [Anaerolinea sp.]|nr:hypothetical protein [Anaerolinea sp.]
MKTICKTKGSNTAFIFLDVEPEYHDIMRNLYYNPVEEGFAKVYPSDTPNLDRIYLNFERYAKEMVFQTARIHPVEWDKSLSAFLQIIEDSSIDWWLTGSAALAVRGLDVVPGDLDLVVDDTSASKLGELLSDYIIEPLQPSPGWIWNWFGRAFLYARLEWVGGVNESADSSQVSDFGPTAAKRLEVVNWHGKDLRVPPLDLQLEVSKRRGLVERAEKISRFLLNGK